MNTMVLNAECIYAPFFFIKIGGDYFGQNDKRVHFKKRKGREC